MRVCLLAIAASLISFGARVAWAEDPELVLEPSSVNAVGRSLGFSSYGYTLAGAGDVNGDGFDDVMVGAWEGDAAFLFLGSPGGVDLSTETKLTSAWDAGWIGFGMGMAAAGDLDGDGYGDLAIGATGGGDSTGSSAGAVLLFSGSPIGVDPSEQVRLHPQDPGSYVDNVFGGSVGAAGDIDADGFDDLIVGAWNYYRDDESIGAAYLYFGSTSGLSPASEVLLLRSDATNYDDFGFEVAGGRDLDGDGIQDVVVSCADGDITSGGWEYRFWCSTIYVYPGGTRAMDEVEPIALRATDISSEEELEDYAHDIALPGDIDGDGYEDLLSSAENRAYMYYGSAEGPTVESEQRIEAQGEDSPNTFAEVVTGVGDLDGDGFQDIGIQCLWIGTRSATCLYFGSAGGVELSSERIIESPVAPLGENFGWGLAGVGDVNGDGRSDFLVGANIAEDYRGAAYLFSPVCDWYLDADGDGYGDPSTHVESCHDQLGYVSNDRDCDDADGSVHGETWYLDADGDGYGTAAGAVLACEQPTGTADSWLDCDDTAAAVYPSAEEILCDGIDQDCDGHDEPPGYDENGRPRWEDCVEDTGSPTDTGGEMPSDTATPGDTAAPGDDGGSGAGGQLNPPPDSPKSGCQCGTRAPLPPAGLLGLAALLAAARRRRAFGQAAHRSPIT